MDIGSLLEWMLYKENTKTSTLKLYDEKDLIEYIQTLMDMPADEDRKLSTGEMGIMTFIADHADELDEYPTSYYETPWLYSAYELAIAFGGDQIARQHEQRNALADQLGWELIINAANADFGTPNDRAMTLLLRNLANDKHLTK